MTFGASFDIFSPSPIDGGRHDQANKTISGDLFLRLHHSAEGRNNTTLLEKTQDTGDRQPGALDTASATGSPERKGAKTSANPSQLGREAESEFFDAIDKGASPQDALEKTQKKFRLAIDLADQARKGPGGKLDERLFELGMSVQQATTKQAEADNAYDRVVRLFSLDDRIKFKNLIDEYWQNPDKNGNAWKEISKSFPHVIQPLLGKEKANEDLRNLSSEQGDVQRELGALVAAQSYTRERFVTALTRAGRMSEAHELSLDANDLTITGTLRKKSSAQLDAGNSQSPRDDHRPGTPGADATRHLAPSEAAAQAVRQYERDLAKGVAPDAAMRALEQRCDTATADSLAQSKTLMENTLSQLASMAEDRAIAERIEKNPKPIDLVALGHLPPEQQEDAQELLNRYNSDTAFDSTRTDALKHMKTRYPELARAAVAKAQAHKIMESVNQLEQQFESDVLNQAAIPRLFAGELKKNSHPGEAEHFENTATQIYLRSIQAEIQAEKFTPRQQVIVRPEAPKDLDI